MDVLVTGGAGFIGSHFIDHLLKETDHSVITFDALTYAGSQSNLSNAKDNSQHQFVEADIRDERAIKGIVDRYEIDTVVNFAAQTHVDRSIENADKFVSTNIGGVESILEVAQKRDLDKVIQISTDEIYGEITDGAFSETDCLSPRNPYAATKAGADCLLQSYYHTHGVPVVLARPSNNFGPRQHREKLIPKLITRANQGEILPIYGDGSNVREWIFVKDTCRAIRFLLDKGKPGEAYNIGSGHERSNLEVARTVIDLVGASEDLIEFVEDRPGHDQRYALDSSKIRSRGWGPEWSFDKGMEETIKYYLKEL